MWTLAGITCVFILALVVVIRHCKSSECCDED